MKTGCGSAPCHSNGALGCVFEVAVANMFGHMSFRRVCESEVVDSQLSQLTFIGGISDASPTALS